MRETGSTGATQTIINHQRTTKEPSGSSAARRSRRCPDSFELSSRLVAWARENHPAVDLEAETAKFRDHEYAQPKSDWDAVWRSWIRKAEEFRGSGQGFKQGGMTDEERKRQRDAEARRLLFGKDYTEGVDGEVISL